MALEHATHTTYKITRFDSEEWLNYNKKERSKLLFTGVKPKSE